LSLPPVAARPSGRPVMLALALLCAAAGGERDMARCG